MKKIKYIILSTALAALPLGAQAQKQAKDSTVNRTVVVEQEYNPAITDASKVNVLPKVELPTVSKKEVEYDATLLPANNIPAPLMQAYTGKESQNKSLPGYLRLGYGNYGNLEARANYRFTLSDKDWLNLTLHANGMNGKLKLLNTPDKWNSYYYRTHAGLDYVHAFDKVDLNVAGHFDLSNFNFLPQSVNSKQKFTAGDIHVEVKSTRDDFPLQFRAETNLMLYERQADFNFNNAQEFIVRTKGEVSGLISEGKSIALALAMDNAFYKNNQFADYTAINLNPYYVMQSDDWKVRLGAHVDLSFGFGKQLRISPDLTAQYTFANKYTLYAQAKGGKLQNDFRRLESLTPYGQPIQQPDATYEQLNAAIGFKASPASGLWLHLYGGYQNLKNDLMTSGMTSQTDFQTGTVYALDFNSAHTNNVYAGATVSYDYKRVVSFNASGLYRNWKTSNATNKYLLAFKPAFEADFSVDVRPISSLLVNLGYQHTTRQNVGNIQADPISNLYLGASYEVFKNFSVYARINNLLNKSYQLYGEYPVQGTNFVGGASFQF